MEEGEIVKIRNSIECWVVAADSSKILLLKVAEENEKNPEFEQPITGGIEVNETPEQACVREVFEETGREIEPSSLEQVIDVFKVKINDDFEVHKTVFIYRGESFTPKLCPDEHIGFRWIAKADVSDALFYQSNKDTWNIVSNEILV